MIKSFKDEDYGAVLRDRQRPRNQANIRSVAARKLFILDSTYLQILQLLANLFRHVF